MITSENQYAITTTELKKFEATLAELKQQDTSKMDFNSQMRHQLYLDANQSQIESFKEEIEKYECQEGIVV